jgi:aryl-alcohol dehydrogenase-like predicted oxidoreductase
MEPAQRYLVPGQASAGESWTPDSCPELLFYGGFMRTRLLGRTGLKVSELCLGTMTFGSVAGGRRVPGCDEKESLAILNAYLERGGNFIDTADSYADGRSEEILGVGLKARRDDVVLATKVFFPAGPGANRKGLSRKHLFEGIEASLRRLQTDYLDLYQVHCFDARTPLDETLSALDALIREGKVRYIGCSNFGAWQLAKALGVSAFHGYARFDCLQPQYSLVCRSIDREILPLCRAEGVGVIAWSPLGGGFLSGKYRSGESAPQSSRLADSDPSTRVWVERLFTERNYGILRAAEEASARLGKTLSQVALAWLLAAPGVTSVIIGARKVSQLQENLAAGDFEFPPDEWKKLDAASALPLEYPQDFQAWVDPLIHADVGSRI